MDDELVGIAKSSIGAEVGLTPAQSARLVGETAGELRKDARAMAKELGLEVDEQARDEGGRFASSGDNAESARMNEAIRAARGTSDDKADGSKMNQLIRAATGRG
jgi:hypothetical protein